MSALNVSDEDMAANATKNDNDYKLILNTMKISIFTAVSIVSTMCPF